MRVFFRLMCVLSVIVTAGCGGFLSEEDNDCRDEPAVAAGLAAFDLPPDYSNFEARCSRWMDHNTIDVRFEMPPQHLETFQAGTEIEAWETDIHSAKVERFELLDARRFSTMTDYLYGETNAELLASGTQQVLVDMSDPAQYTVYLTYFVSY